LGSVSRQLDTRTQDGDEDTYKEWMDIVAMKAKVESNSKLFHTSA